MYFDFEDRRPDTPHLPQPLTRLEMVLLTIVFHLSLWILMMLGPQLPWVKAYEAERQRIEAELQQKALERQRENARFVFVQPRVDIQAMKPPPPRSELSDIDRRAATVERAPKPTNSMPFSRGNTSERIEAAPPAQPRGQNGNQPEPDPGPSQPDPSRQGLTLPQSPAALEPRASESPQRQTSRGPAMGVLADAIRNAQKYVQKDGFVNLQGGGDQDFAPSIQFDTKGVEFGPWLRRFIAQIRRNWFVPQSAMMLKGHVVITFYVGKDGRISELKVVRPSQFESFNNSAFGALAASNPTQPLPPEYPDDKAFFTVTFYFNEDPGTR
ncbi:MAG TPA: TonB family protein [Vicinamibacterales bacterium]